MERKILQKQFCKSLEDNLPQRNIILKNSIISFPKERNAISKTASDFRNQAEMAHTCRGTISLHGAVIHTENQSCNFIVSNGGGTQVKASPTYCPFFYIFFLHSDFPSASN